MGKPNALAFRESLKDLGFAWSPGSKEWSRAGCTGGAVRRLCDAAQAGPRLTRLHSTACCRQLSEITLPPRVSCLLPGITCLLLVAVWGGRHEYTICARTLLAGSSSMQKTGMFRYNSVEWSPGSTSLKLSYHREHCTSLCAGLRALDHPRGSRRRGVRPPRHWGPGRLYPGGVQVRARHARPRRWGRVHIITLAASSTACYLV